MPLSDLDRQILTIEDQHWRYAGRKDAAIRDLGISHTRFAQRLAELARDPDAAAEWPLLVARVQRRLDAARRQRRGRLSA